MSSNQIGEISIAPPSTDTGAPEDKPETKEETAPASKPATGKKGKRSKSPKKPKKKKLSKKERARLKREKEEQERLEQERREAELRDQREREYEQKKREEQQQRLLEEDNYIHKLRDQRIEDGKKIRSAKAQTDDWEIFKQCDHFYDVRSQSDVNTFITQWREIDETDLQTLFDRIKQSHTILNQLKSIMEIAEVARENSEYERCKRQIQEIHDLINQKMEQITVRHLVFSDKFAGAKNEVQVSAQADGKIFGMWVNLSKNPRIKEIEFPGLTVEIPKSVAMTSLAIRMMMSPEKPFNEEYLFLNKIILCDFLQLPTPPKRIGTMTLRQSPNRNALVNITYPLRNVNTAQPPLNFKVTVEPEFFTDYVKDATVVMINNDTVSGQHISKVSLDPETNTVNFSSMNVGIFGIAVPRYCQFPLRLWEITSLSETSIEIYIKTNQGIELAIVVDGEGLCSMEAPFEFQGLTPVSAVEFLQEKGINIVAPKQCEGLNPKTPELEAVLNQGIADTVTGFMVSWSKWNEMLPPDRAMLIMREMKTFDEPSDEYEDADGPEPEAPANGGDAPEGGEEAQQPEKPPKHKNVMKCILAKANHITEVPYTEDQYECNMKPIDDASIHQHIFPMFFEKASKEVQDRVKSAPSFLCDSALYFFNQLRLFSMTKAETES
ncbi:hypothetical protein TRFO_20485 [Tritrichomonas foetus]|uniref:Uncharacterized protein n=1 Tax=Tritrichomonas foetus TaxID=1144522 RepID=A0A1J4KG00_9EUKA|nr:hypothetical protein TRFO_20485 [Tritrichomonas foetus]|eukprot:OHT10343.1 hypothetical protein TRFO_20485 [Tritrichomonas foetus]